MYTVHTHKTLGSVCSTRNFHIAAKVNSQSPLLVCSAGRFEFENRRLTPSFLSRSLSRVHCEASVRETFALVWCLMSKNKSCWNSYIANICKNEKISSLFLPCWWCKQKQTTKVKYSKSKHALPVLWLVSSTLLRQMSKRVSVTWVYYLWRQILVGLFDYSTHFQFAAEMLAAGGKVLARVFSWNLRTEWNE